MDLSRIVPFSFNAFMAAYFAYAFLFPEESGGWLSQSGIFVMVLEFLGVFVLLLLAHVMGKQSGWIVTTHGHPWLILGFVMLVAFLFSAVFGAWVLFAYFSASTLVKAFQLRAASDAFSEGTQAVYSTLFLVLGAFAAVLLEPSVTVVGVLFRAAFAVARSSDFAYTGGLEDPAFVVVWGVFYFAGMALVCLKPDLLPVKPATPEQLAWARDQAPDWLKKLK